MVWTKLFRVNNIEKFFFPSFINGFWRGPSISPRYQAKIRKAFYWADLPFIYKKQYLRPMLNTNTPYNKFPNKFGKWETHNVKRLAKIKHSLFLSKEREIKARQEKLNRSRLRGGDQIIKEIMPFFLKPQKVVKAEVDPEKKVSKKRVAETLKGTPIGPDHSIKRKQKEVYKALLVDGMVKEEDFKEMGAKILK